MRAFGVFTVAAALSLCALRARAQSDADFETRVEGCPPDLAERLPAVVRLEVMVLMRERVAEGPFVQRFTIRCEADSARIDAMAFGATRSVVVDSQSIAPEHRARAFGLAAAELVDAMYNERAERTAKQVPAPKEPAPVVPVPERARIVAVGLGGVVQRVGRPGALVFGARLGVAWRPLPIVSPALSIDAVAGNASTDPAVVGVRSISAAAHLLVGHAGGPLDWGVGPGVHVGWARLEGKPTAESGLEGSALSGAWAGPALRARIASWFGSGGAIAPFAALEGDAGLVLAPVRGTQDGSRRVFSMEGPWLTAALTMGASF